MKIGKIIPIFLLMAGQAHAAGVPNSMALQDAGAASIIDLTGSNASALYVSGNSSVSYFPSVGHDAGDHQRGQELIRFFPAQDASISEAGLSIDGVINSGSAKLYANSSSYGLNDLIDVNGAIYRVTTAGTSAATGSGPTGTGVNIADGTMRVAWQCHDQCNAKMPLFVSATAGPQAGHSWGGVVDLVLNPGWNGHFASGFEIDSQNNSGSDCATCQTLFISGDAGSSREQAAISIYTPSSTNYKWLDGIVGAGSRTAQNDFIRDATSSSYSYFDQGMHNWGLYLSGNYAYGAANFGGAVQIASDYSRINLYPASGSNPYGWRVISNVASAADGTLVLQHTNDRFITNFVNAITASATGSISVGGPVQLPSMTVAQLPACSSAIAGSVAFVTDASAPLYNAAVTGGGAVRALALCNGTVWTAH